MPKTLMTVTGPVEAAAAGLTLPHEHILVDFAGAEISGPHRYDTDEVERTMTPYLEQIRRHGVQTFVDCTPMYLARDVRVLRSLAERTGIKIITNTGQYKEPFLPARTFKMSPEQLAAEWIDEWENGIDGTDVKPGFIKTAVNPGHLLPVQRKVIRAAAITAKETGLAIGTHTGVAVAANEVLDILENVGVDPGRWIYIHAQNEESIPALLDVARRGPWIELDGIGPDTVDRHLRALTALLDAGFGERILLSHDAGWYRVGEPSGGRIRPYTSLFTEFIPRLREEEVDETTIRRLTRKNPGEAFAVA